MNDIPAFTPVHPVVAQPAKPSKQKAMIAERKAKLIDAPPMAVEIPEAAAVKQTPRKKTTSRAKLRKQAQKASTVVKRQRAMRVAPMRIDVTTALTAMIDVSARDQEAMIKIVGLLNPLSRPARIKLLVALQRMATQ